MKKTKVKEHFRVTPRGKKVKIRSTERAAPGEGEAKRWRHLSQAQRAKVPVFFEVRTVGGAAYAFATEQEAAAYAKHIGARCLAWGEVESGGVGAPS